MLARPALDRRGWLVRVMILALLYCLSGWAGLQLAQPPGYATPIWPPSGIMLGMLLLWGGRQWPGVWVGSFLLNTWVGYAQAGEVTPTALAIAAAIASGSTAEGLAGAWAVRRHVAAPTVLDDGVDVLRFFALGGFLASAIAATVGCLALLLGRGLPVGELAFTWLTWWIGDCMGVFLVAPLLLVAAAHWRGSERRRLAPVAATVLVSLAVGAIVVQQTNRTESRRIEVDFDRNALAVDRHLQSTLEEAVGTMQTLAEYIETASPIVPAQFDRFAQGQLERASGLSRVGRAPRTVSGEGLFEIDGVGQRRPVQRRDEYFPIRYLYSRPGYADIRGFDLSSERLRAETLAAARDTDTLRLTPRIDLIFGLGPGVLAIAPVNAGDDAGFVAGTLQFDRLMTHVLGGHPLQHAAVSLIDAGEPGSGVVYRSATVSAPKLSWAADHEVGGRLWRLQIEAGDAYLFAHRSLQAWLTQVGVLLFSALLGGFLMVLTGKSSRVQSLVAERTAELADKNQALLREIAERERSESRLRLSVEVFEHLGEAIMITDADNRIVSVNRAFTEITGYGEDEVRGRTPKMLSSGQHNRVFYDEMWQKLRETGSWRGEVWDRRKNGQIYPEWLNISLVRDDSGRTTHHVAVFSDISERKAAEERILYLAQVDAVTNLPNRYLLGDRLQQTMESARRDGQAFAVMFIDIDRFKNINDSLGHSVGDALLREMAERLRSSVRASDTVARHGGDEFVIVMPGVADAEQVAHVAGKILATIGRPFSVEQHLLATTASIGIAMYPADGGDAESLMKNADAAMYVAKSAGRNAFRFFTRDMNARVQEFLKIENELRRALERGELRVYYQPQFDVRSGEVVAAEALVRWQHPDRGLVLPGEFMHVAEESGLVEAIDDWVLHEACRQNRAWQLQGLRQVPVSVNLSAIGLHRDDTAEKVRQALRASDLDARWLELEVTESMLMRDVERVQQLLQALRAMGVLIALDDFGTGYSSLAYLRRFPLSALKVDRSFVRDLQVDGNDAVICRAVIALGRTLGLRVIAEGVENAQQLAFLRDNHCDSVQGALFSWGVPADEMASFLVPSYVCAAALPADSIL